MFTLFINILSILTLFAFGDEKRLVRDDKCDPRDHGLDIERCPRLPLNYCNYYCKRKNSDICDLRQCLANGDEEDFCLQEYPFPRKIFGCERHRHDQDHYHHRNNDEQRHGLDDHHHDLDYDNYDLAWRCPRSLHAGEDYDACLLHPQGVISNPELRLPESLPSEATGIDFTEYHSNHNNDRHEWNHRDGGRRALLNKFKYENNINVEDSVSISDSTSVSFDTSSCTNFGVGLGRFCAYSCSRSNDCPGPTMEPTDSPTEAPTPQRLQRSSSPSTRPTRKPTAAPSPVPTANPTPAPTPTSTPAVCDTLQCVLGYEEFQFCTILSNDDPYEFTKIYGCKKYFPDWFDGDDDNDTLAVTTCPDAETWSVSTNSGCYSCSILSAGLFRNWFPQPFEYGSFLSLHKHQCVANPPPETDDYYYYDDTVPSTNSTPTTNPTSTPTRKPTI